MTEDQAEELVDGLVAVVRQTADRNEVEAMLERTAPSFDNARMTDALMAFASLLAGVIVEAQRDVDAPDAEIVCGIVATLALDALDAYAARIQH